MKFSESFYKCWIRTKFDMHLDMFLKFKNDKIVDPETLVKRDIIGLMNKEIEKKIELQYEKNDIREKPNSEYHSIRFDSELLVCNRKELFDLFYSFNQLPEEVRINFIKWVSSEEFYTNQIRYDRLNEILEENNS